MSIPERETEVNETWEFFNYSERRNSGTGMHEAMITNMRIEGSNANEDVRGDDNFAHERATAHQAVKGHFVKTVGTDTGRDAGRHNTSELVFTFSVSEKRIRILQQDRETIAGKFKVSNGLKKNRQTKYEDQMCSREHLRERQRLRHEVDGLRTKRSALISQEKRCSFGQ